MRDETGRQSQRGLFRGKVGVIVHLIRLHGWGVWNLEVFSPPPSYDDTDACTLMYVGHIVGQVFKSLTTVTTNHMLFIINFFLINLSSFS